MITVGGDKAHENPRPLARGSAAPAPGAKTARGLATQAAFVRAAQTVFERDGFLAFRRERTARAQPWIAGNRHAIRRLQRAGRADRQLDPLTAARALSTMVSRTAYITFVLEEEGAEGDRRRGRDAHAPVD
jgi:hypothetical protein